MSNNTARRPPRIPALGSQITSIVSVTLALVIIGLLALTAVGARNITDQVRRALTVTVRVADDTTPQAVSTLKRQFNHAPYVANYTFVTADQVLAQEVQHIGAEAAALLDENPFTAEFELHLAPAYACHDSLVVVQRRLTANPAIAEVITDDTVVSSVNATVNRLSWVLGTIAAAMLLISFVLINNTVSLSIYSRRFLIRTMQLVGASPGFIRRPFVGAAALSGLISGLLACGFMAALQGYGINFDPDIDTLLPWWPDVTIIYVALTVLGILICIVAAWLATTRYLRRSYDKLYKS